MPEEIRYHILQKDLKDNKKELLKDNKDFFTAYITKCFNESLKSAKFPNRLKSASLTPVFTKNARTSKNNYRPVSVLPVISKIFERLICNQLSAFC